MDSFDIFRQLTTGAKFSRKSNNQQKIQQNSGTSWILGTKKDENEHKNVTSDEKQENFNIEDDPCEGEKSSFQLVNEQILAKNNKKSKKDEKREQQKIKRNSEEELNKLRNTYRIKVHGKNIPPPIQAFDELKDNYNVPSKVIDSLTVCGYSAPTPIQMQAIPVMLLGRSLMACAPTGSGKTVAFLTPIIRDLKGPRKKGFRAIILCPTRELAKQTQRECLHLTENIGLKIHVISKVNQAEQQYGPKSSKKYDILVSTPKRVCYLLNQEPSLLDLKNIEWFVIDEADKLMEEGTNSFKQQLEQILDACTNSARKIALFSATYTVPVAKWAIKNLKGLIRVTIGEHNSATDTVQQELLFVGSESGKLLAFRDLIRNGLQPPVLVFVQTKDRAKQLFQELIYDGINVDVIHADRTQLQRDNVVRAFREGKIWVLICTELMGRGIDFKGVNLVVNYDFPPTPISYIHRIGRTGRAGRSGKAITYFTQDDRINLRSIAQIIKNSGGSVPDFMLKLKKPKKSDKKLLAKKPLERDDISTTLKFEHKRKKQFEEGGKFVKIQKTSEETEKVKKNSKKKKYIKG